MKKSLLLLFSLSLSISVFAQNSEEQKKINEDVWFPFMEAYEKMDVEAYNGVHIDDVMRVEVSRKNLITGDTFRNGNKQYFDNLKSRGFTQSIQFSFYNRLQSGDRAYEIGIYKLTLKNGENSRSMYGKFHVTLHKVNDKWKIAIDSDTTEGNLGEEDFQKGDVLNK